MSLSYQLPCSPITASECDRRRHLHLGGETEHAPLSQPIVRPIERGELMKTDESGFPLEASNEARGGGALLGVCV